jgi:hypothetical protein
MNQGLDLPGEDNVFIDEDSDSDQEFEIGIENIGYKKPKAEEDSFDRNDSEECIEISDNF